MSGQSGTGKRYIYFATGYLTPPEKELVPIYYERLRNIYKAEAPGYTFGIRCNPETSYELVLKPSCTKKQFLDLWRDKSTVGIIWYSHGDPNTGYPWAYPTEPWKGPTPLNPFEIPKSGSNLRSFAVLSCGSIKAEDLWREKIRHRNPAVKTVSGLLEDGSMDARDETLSWIEETQLYAPERPALGARYLLQHALGTFEPGSCVGCSCDVSQRSGAQQRRSQQWRLFTEPAKVISQDHFEPDRAFVPYRRIPRVGIEASHYTTHKVRFGDRVWYLAEDYGYTSRKRFKEDVERLNPQINFRDLKVGQTIKVPTKVGVPRELSTPWALRSRQVQRARTVTAGPEAATPSTLGILKQRLVETPATPTRRPTPTFDTVDTLRRLERQARDRQATQQWLQRVQDQLDRRPSSSGLTGQTSRSTFERLDRQLRRTATPLDRTSTPTFSTMDTLKRLEREAVDRQATRQWLQRVQQQLDRRPLAGGGSASTLGVLDQHLKRF